MNIADIGQTLIQMRMEEQNDRRSRRPDEDCGPK